MTGPAASRARSSAAGGKDVLDVRRHVPLPDPDVGRDFCALCHLPRANQRHVIDAPLDDISRRVLGEREDLEDD